MKVLRLVLRIKNHVSNRLSLRHLNHVFGRGLLMIKEQTRTDEIFTIALHCIATLTACSGETIYVGVVHPTLQHDFSIYNHLCYAYVPRAATRKVV